MTVFFSLVYCSSVELMEMLNDKNMLNAIHTIEKKNTRFEVHNKWNNNQIKMNGKADRM